MRQIFLTLLTAISLTACGNGDAEQKKKDLSQLPVDSVAVNYYNLRVSGNFTAYVEAMQSCDGTTPEYKKSVADMLRQHQKQIEEEKKGVSHVEVLRVEMHSKNRMANAFLSVTYNDGSREEVLFPLVFDGNSWRIQ